MPATIVALVGSTGTGKTALSLKLAARLGAEIVNCDSRQVYRYLDIGTAKPTVGERAAVPLRRELSAWAAGVRGVVEGGIGALVPADIR